MGDRRNFVMAFTASQGSSAMQSQLGLAPEIGVVGFEPFDGYRFQGLSKEEKEVLYRDRLPDWFAAVFENNLEAYRELPEWYAQFTENKIWLPGTSIRGFKFRYLEWLKVRESLELWDELSSLQTEPLLTLLAREQAHLFLVERRNILLQALSQYKGVHLQFKLRSEGLSEDERAPVTVDPKELRSFVARIDEARQKMRQVEDAARAMKGLTISHLIYEDFLYRPEQFFTEATAHLGLSYSPEEVTEILRQPNTFQKVHSDRLEEIVLNAEELRETFPEESQRDRELREEYRIE